MPLPALSPATSARAAEQLAQIREAVAENPANREIVAAHADFLRVSEEKLLSELRGEHPPADAPGWLEFGAVLHYLHRTAAADAAAIGLPEARLRSEHVDAADAAGILPRVGSDGTLIGFGKWETFDPGWLQAFNNYILLKLGKIRYHAFNTNPAVIALPASGTITIAVVGDWGTGNWDDGSETPPALAVMNQVVALQPNYTIHLGDVYYSGTQAEEDANYVKFWQAATDGSFMLNSNHEMYDGANGYFDIGLAAAPFAQQQQTSYFALMNDDVAILGLDSAYADPSTLFMRGAIPSTSPQVAWLQSLDLGNRTVIVMTHHNPLSTTGAAASGLWQDVVDALGGAPNYWYWGHIHNGIVYNTPLVNGANTYGRCAGHGAIPFGNASELTNAPNVAWYAQTPDPDAPPQGLRVYNGFAVLTIDGANVTETLYDQLGNQAWP
ncbi:MAG TPA: metallophosphoesterase [Thermoanaerobaculia bacterium]|jgi:hypothetical protein